MVRFVAIFWISLAIMVSLSGLLLIRTPQANVMAAVFPPWWRAPDIFEAAARAGTPLRLGRLNWVVIVKGENALLSSRLRAAGALFLLDADSFVGCGS